jgi:hypothetical protein
MNGNQRSVGPVLSDTDTKKKRIKNYDLAAPLTAIVG